MEKIGYWSPGWNLSALLFSFQIFSWVSLLVYYWGDCYWCYSFILEISFANIVAWRFYFSLLIRWSVCSMMEWMWMQLHGVPNQRGWPPSTLLPRVDILKLWMNCLNVEPTLMLELKVLVAVSIILSGLISLGIDYITYKTGIEFSFIFCWNCLLFLLLVMNHCKNMLSSVGEGKGEID